MILVTKASGDLVLKNKLPPSSVSAALRQLNPIHKNGYKVILEFREVTVEKLVVGAFLLLPLLRPPPFPLQF